MKSDRAVTNGEQSNTPKKATNQSSASICVICGPNFLRLTLAAVLTLAVPAKATACLACYRPPYRSLLERIETSDQVIVARTIDETRDRWQGKVIRVIRGKDVDVDESVTVNKLKTDRMAAGALQLLRRSVIDDGWEFLGTVDRELLGFLAVAVQLTPKPAALKTVRDQTEYIRYFAPYLEHANREIADSAYTKLAGAPYAALRELKQEFRAEQLLAWIENPQVARKRKSLYITLLGICGGQAESQRLKEWIDEGWASQNTDNLAALLTAHAELNGEQTIRFIEKSYLQNRERQLGELIGAVNALRVHGQADGTISRDRIQASFQLLLRERPQLVEMIIEDCARWQDWSIAPKLMEIHAGGQQPWNNAMIIKYLKACPLPEAKRFVTRVSATDTRAK